MKQDTKYKAIAGAFLVFGLTVIFIGGGIAISQKNESCLVESNFVIPVPDDRGAYVDVDKCPRGRRQTSETEHKETSGTTFDPVTSGGGLGGGLGGGSPSGGGSWGF